MAAITLSPGVRSNLLALRDTSDLLSTTQTRLATGKRINSALDNPVNYFTSQSLDHRANDLSALLDRIAQAQQVLHATDNGLSALMKLVESAKSIAQQAKQAPQTATGYYYTTNFVGSTDVTPQPATTITGGVPYGQTQFNGTVIRVGGVPYTVASSSGGPTLDQVIIDINSSPGLGPSGAATASKDASGHLVLTSNSAATMTVDPLPGGALATGLINPDFVQVVPGLSGTSLTVQANDTPAKTITFGNAPGEVANYGDLTDALAGTNVGAYIYPFGGPPRLQLFVINPNMINSKEPSLTIGGTALAPLGLASGARYGSLTGSPDPTRASLAQQYNEILQQIDRLTGDASYNGTNLLKGDTLHVTFNETGSSALSINGVDDSVAGLGMTAVSSNGFQLNTDVDAHLGAMTAALATLRAQASQFGSSLGTVQIRQNFTDRIVATLQSGADGLVLADSNQEGANLLALQTRQQLSTTALSLASQNDQNVLKLFS